MPNDIFIDLPLLSSVELKMPIRQFEAHLQKKPSLLHMEAQKYKIL